MCVICVRDSTKVLKASLCLLKRPGNSSIDRSVLMRIYSFEDAAPHACILMQDYCKDVQKKHLEKLISYLQRIHQPTQEDSVAK